MDLMFSQVLCLEFMLPPTVVIIKCKGMLVDGDTPPSLSRLTMILLYGDGGSEELHFFYIY